MAKEIRMVDISEKPVTMRTATASAVVRMNPQTAQMVAEGKVPKGDVLAAAQVAAYFAIKRTPDLLPLCHPIPISGAEVKFDLRPEEGLLRIEVTVNCTAQTGAEMEALTGAAIAALTVYDMCKGIEPGIVVERIQLERKSGGKSGEWERS
ncbi:MAG: cyclic pyranopterin monophosphate synthase MoaC [Armatimonadetes bacterium]|nr:cyclic pyranopterin monophosphate synthase MoaC [Armatimonadota bacterium]MCX7967850.1 cyclic pyranopterin monophosphate synthase MoaC [Armatimonadota bacterium]MDW8143696.1 cyclic pyranopterin monophosphate synthase MoaC [Armatimonadota bacterium]